MRISKIQIFLLFITYLSIFNVSATNTSSFDISVTIDLMLEDHDTQTYFFNITSEDLLTISIEVDRSKIDISIDRNGGSIDNNSFSVSDSSIKRIAFNDDGNYYFEISNPGMIAGGDTIHVTGSYTITEGLANSAEIILYFVLYVDPPRMNPTLLALLGLIGLIVCSVFIVYVRRKSKSDSEKFIQKFGAPDRDKAWKVKESGYPNYKLYQEGQKAGARTYFQYEVVKRYNVDSYDLANRIARGGFPDYQTFKNASEQGIKKYDDFVKIEQRKKALMKLMTKAESVHRDDFMAVMGFKNTSEFMNWFMNLPEDSPIILSGDKVEFRIRKGEDEDLLKTPKTKPMRLDELADNQRRLIRDLLEDKALPHSHLVSSFGVSDLEVINTLQLYVPEGTYLTRISDLYRLVKPSPTCQICHRHTEDIPHFQCDTCNRYLCQGHYMAVKQVGYPTCPECGGNLISLPIKCRGCGVAYLDLSNMKNLHTCQFCNYKLESPDISGLKPSQLSDDQIKEISRSRNDTSSLKGKENKGN